MSAMAYQIAYFNLINSIRLWVGRRPLNASSVSTSKKSSLSANLKFGDR
ncbi:hypothetical protein PS862_05880 [Pseudomonas fluorescens]|uniref:Uncharacterized protein n=1 Tax=Pseudomonas fluorescens TaxID=294 RepID=A0A5E7Q6X8_PSEFL|nr:hypothetical protein CFT9_19125 [Pseudomonas sp. CFT9]EPL11584.1 hypothetical protein CF150_12873 [Pseudomonas sp. CF150]VVP57916.1 hypothetical protein PS862_05880 [Pseudomonas fluorescens]